MEKNQTWKINIGRPIFHPEKIVEIGPYAFMLAEKSLLIRKDILFREVYVANHQLLNSYRYFALHQDFQFKEKTLSVKVSRGFGNGPAGDRWYLSASYDGESIGSANALRSYMGGGVNGTSPIIRTKDWMLIFRMESIDTDLEVFSIEYYEKVLSTDWTLDRDYSDYDSTPLDLSKHLTKVINFPQDKNIDYELRIPDKKGSDIMRIIRYPNYQYYSLWVSTGEYKGMGLYDDTFFAPKIGKNPLIQMEFVLGGVSYISGPLFCAGYSIPESLYHEWDLNNKGIRQR